MILKEFLPHPAFREFVRCYRIVHLEFDKRMIPSFKAYPPRPEECLHFFLRDGESVELINCLKKDFRLTVALMGQQTSIINRYPGENFLNFQIVFQPTGLFCLTGVPSSERFNQYIDAETIFSKKFAPFTTHCSRLKTTKRCF